MTAPTDLAQLSAAQRQRLAYIEFRLWFYGEVARKQVLEHFEVATAAGTRDLALYQALAPGNARYERKLYRYQPGFQPLFTHAVERVLAALTSGFGAGEPRAGGELLSHAVPARLNQPSLDTLATVTRALHARQVLRLRYHSIRKGDGLREIVPHSLVDSGLRWHVRAFDRTKGHFRDLVLTRMEDVQAAPEAAPPQPGEAIEADIQWQRLVDLRLVPHPAHPRAQTIERDFGMQQGQLAVTLRAAVAGYVLRQWQVDCSADARLRGPEFRLWLQAPEQQLQGVVSAALAPGFATAGAPPHAAALR
jgi:hypothetical protein